MTQRKRTIRPQPARLYSDLRPGIDKVIRRSDGAVVLRDPKGCTQIIRREPTTSTTESAGTSTP